MNFVFSNKLFLKVSSIFFISLLFFSNSAYSAKLDTLHKPFTLAKIYKSSVVSQTSIKVNRQLVNAGYKIVGTYKPDNTVTIFIVTSPNLLKAATKSKYGGFGVGIRVSITQVGNDVQVSHNNPTYMAIAYNMNSYLGFTRKKLAQALGYVKDFGGKGLASKELGDYNYAFGLEGFSGFMDLSEHKSHKKALEAVEKGFNRKLKNMTKVYRIDIPGKKQTVFGVSLKNDSNDLPLLNDKFVMDIIDNKEFRRSAHLPYEIMVIGKRVMMMHPHFRIAINFTDLRMFGKHSFAKLMDLPYIYEEYFIQLAGGVWPIPEEDF